MTQAPHRFHGKTIGITGIQGLLGSHAALYYHYHCGANIVGADRETFAAPKKLAEFVSQCDVILHFAGANRGDDAEVSATNVALAEQLCAALKASHKTPHVYYASSLHEERDTAYGNSKREAGRLLQSWADNAGAPLGYLILPHIFGEGGKPFYNSVVATFCHQLAGGEEPTIDQDSTIYPLHTSEVFAFIDSHAEGGRYVVDGHTITVSALLEKLRGFKKSYADSHIIPDVTQTHDRHLFNMLRSYLYPSHYPCALTLNTDDRGSLFEAIKGKQGGQVFMSTTKPGITRGNHFHFHKIERFLVVSGEADITIRNLRDASGEVHSFKVSGENPVYIDMPTLHTHAITNIGTAPLVTLFWADEFFDKEKPDTYYARVT